MAEQGYGRAYWGVRFLIHYPIAAGLSGGALMGLLSVSSGLVYGQWELWSDDNTMVVPFLFASAFAIPFPVALLAEIANRCRSFRLYASFGAIAAAYPPAVAMVFMMYPNIAVTRDNMAFLAAIALTGVFGGAVFWFLGWLFPPKRRQPKA